MDKFMYWIGAVLVAVVLIFTIAAILAFPTMWLVNYVFSPVALQAVFGGPIAFWKAFWLNFLCGMLFKSNATVKK